ncbi:MAG: DUF4190 domain-containing protein [Planctomycetota bacterium]
MAEFSCPSCDATLRTPPGSGGRAVLCPKCRDVVTAPEDELLEGVVVDEPEHVAAVAPTQQRLEAASGAWQPGSTLKVRGPVRRYGFNCQYCSSRLEANTAVAGQEGQCPTCSNTIIIPILDRSGRLIDPMTGKVIKQDPHPVHAYAAAGDHAPLIERGDDGHQYIRCPRCTASSPVTANNCRNCGMPFTMEGTTLEAAGSSNGMATASLVLGIVGLPAFCTVVVPLLAVVFGAVAVRQTNENGQGGRGMAIAGIVCGSVGLLMSMMLYLS